MNYNLDMVLNETILDRVIDLVSDCLDPESARKLVELRADASVTAVGAKMLVAGGESGGAAANALDI